MQKRTANYRHLWNPVNSLMPGGNKRSYILEVAGLFNMYDLLLPPDIKGLKLIYTFHNFVILHCMPSHTVFFA